MIAEVAVPPRAAGANVRRRQHNTQPDQIVTSGADHACLLAAAEAGHLLHLATAILYEHAGGDFCHATVKLLELARAAAGQVATVNVTPEVGISDLADDASCSMAQALAVLDALAQAEEDDPTVLGVIELTRLAKAKIDDLPAGCAS